MDFEHSISSGTINSSAETSSPRVAWLDAVRTLAISCVLLTHAISYSHILDGDIKSVRWSICLILRFIAITGVPLFLMLSGYLCINKKPSRRYYAGIIPILLSYLVIASGSVITRNIVSPGSFSLFTALLGILDFTAHGYAWYVEMYIGLFLIIPFLNILYGAITQKEKKLLIGILAVLTVLPPTVISFHVFDTRLDVLPNYWEIIYPITFYFIGAYLKEHPVRINRLNKVIFASASTAIPVLLCYIKTMIDGSYAWYMMNGFSSVTALLCGISYFTLLTDIRPPRAVSFTLKHISLCSFEMYMFSYITDHIMVYLLAKCGVTSDAASLVLIFAGSFILSFIISFVFRLASVPFSRLLVNAVSKEKKLK